MVYTNTISLLHQKSTVLFRTGIKIRVILGEVDTCYEILPWYKKITTLPDFKVSSAIELMLPTCN